MADYGLTSVGWLSKPLDVIEAEVDDGLKKILGESAGTESDGSIPLRSMAGQLKTLMVDRESGFWDKLQALSSVVDPAQAVDAALDTVCALSGTKREPAEFTTVTGVCTGTPNTQLPIGRKTKVLGTGALFDSQVATNPADPNFPSSTIASVSNWGITTAYALGGRVTANGNVYQCTLAGTSSGSGPGPAGTTLGATIVDGSCNWVFVGAGTGAVDVLFTAEVAGPIGALANHLTQIATPISGWTSITNLLDAVAGRVQETNTALRLRRDAELAQSGNSTADAIRANVLAVNQSSTDPSHQPPTDVRVLFNDTDFVDSNGLPAHSVEVIVTGGTDADIATEIWESVAAGTATYGTQASTVIDEQGNPQTVRWTRPIPVPIYVKGTLWYDASKWPATGAAALVVQAALSALLTFGETYPVGQSVRALPLGAAIVDGPSALNADGSAQVPAPVGSPTAPGMLDVSPLNIGTSPSPSTSTAIPIGVRQVAQFNSSNVDFTATAETP